ncbi:unnamed protein product [Closterium sp. Naga37s-1]|nr:unnamed protein product [Closterium sp. Naga37s-1]
MVAVGGKGSAIPLLRMRQWGEGTCSTCPPCPPPLLLHLSAAGAAVGEGMGVAGVANLLSPERLLHRPFSYLPLMRVQRCSGGEGICHPPAADAAVGGGDLQHLPPLPPPLLLHLSAAGAAVGEGMGVAGVANLLSPERLLHRPFSYLPLLRVQRCSGGEGICHPPAADVAVGGGDLQHLPPLPPPLLLHLSAAGAAVGEGMGVAGVANLLSPERLLHRPFSYLPLLRVQRWGGGDLQHQPPPPPPPPFSYLPLLRVQQWGGGDLQHQPPPAPPPPPSPPSPAAGAAVGGGYGGGGCGCNCGVAGMGVAGV